MMNRQAVFVTAANYRTDVRTCIHYGGEFHVRLYDGRVVEGPLDLATLDPDKTFERVLTDLLGEEPSFREDKRDARWHDARAKMFDLTVRETVI